MSESQNDDESLIVYGTLTARNPQDVTQTLFVETGRWVAAEEYERLQLRVIELEKDGLEVRRQRNDESRLRHAAEANVSRNHDDECECDACALLYFYQTGHYPKCGVAEGTQAGACSCGLEDH